MLLQLNEVDKAYVKGNAGVRALNKVTLGMEAGEFVSIGGPSGSGKTTLLMVAGTLLEPDHGQVTILEQQPYLIDANERALFRARQIGFVFQQFHLIPYFSLLENIRAALTGLPADSLLDQTDPMELLGRFGLLARKDHYPSELSSGERQRCCLARAFMNKPKLLIADEPTGNLDEQNAKIVFEELRKFADSGGAVLLATHDERASDRVDKKYWMESGTLRTKP